MVCCPVFGSLFYHYFCSPCRCPRVLRGTSVPTSTMELPLPLGFELKSIKWEMEGGLQGTRNKTKHLKHVGPRWHPPPRVVPGSGSQRTLFPPSLSLDQYASFKILYGGVVWKLFRESSKKSQNFSLQFYCIFEIYSSNAFDWCIEHRGSSFKKSHAWKG